LAPLPGPLTELALRGRRDETGAEQAMLEELSDPGAVLNIGLAPRNLFDVLSVHPHEGEPSFEQVPDRAPVHADRFHRDVSNALRGHPGG
jgi:hypothetical protein